MRKVKMWVCHWDRCCRILCGTVTLDAQNETLVLWSVLLSPPFSLLSFAFTCSYDYLAVCVCTTWVPGACRGQKRTSDALELRLQMVITLSCQFGETEFRLSARVESVLNCWSSSHSQHSTFQNIFSNTGFSVKKKIEECQHPCLLPVDVPECHRKV